MRKIFKDRALHKKFERDGYIVIPVFDEQEIRNLKAIYDQHPIELEGNFLNSIWSANIESKTKIDLSIRNLVMNKLAAYLEDYKPMVNCFIVKKPGENSHCYIHQDRTYTDESRFTSVTAWYPLQDVDEQNGAIKVFKGSHKIFKQLRGPNIPVVFKDYVGLLELEHMKPLAMKAGEVVIFDNRLIHASDVNCSNRERIAAVSVMIPREASPMLYYKGMENENNVEVFEFDDDAYIASNVNDRPQGPGIRSLGFQPLSDIRLSAGSFKIRYGKMNSLKRFIMSFQNNGRHFTALQFKQMLKCNRKK